MELGCSYLSFSRVDDLDLRFGVIPAKKGFMANGKPGDHPITDMLIHGAHPFPPDMEALLREILGLDPGFPDGKRRYLDQVTWERRFFDWEAGRHLDEGRRALMAVLDELRVKGSEEP